MRAMAAGRINITGQPTVSIVVLNPGRQQFVAFNPIVDTGFNGDLQLPFDDIARLGLTATEKIKTQLADGQVVEADVYSATALWLGNPITIDIIASERNIQLIGTNLFWGTSMTVQWRFGGQVIITKL